MQNEWEIRKVYDAVIEDEECVENDGEFLDAEHKATLCPVCGVISEDWQAEDFTVEVSCDGNVAPHGMYWVEHEEELKEAIKCDD